ncbi:MAG: hypothetical protein Q9225_002799 [Loekoesia sp. 1 TL-2023]
MASTTLAKSSRLDLSDLSTPPLASITDLKHLSSYNWIEAFTPTIAVPGSPPLWSAPGAPRQLKKDSCSSTSPKMQLATRTVTKNTAIFSREETAIHEYIGPGEFRGYGHEFEKVYTTSQISGSTGHPRIISYRFGDLNFIVSHETDGYVDLGTRIPSSNGKDPESDSLSRMLGDWSLSPINGPPVTAPTGSKLTIKKEGQVISPESTFEIKKGVSHKPLEFQEVAPQLWVSQTFKLVLAYHYKGTFQRPEVEDVATPIKI